MRPGQWRTHLALLLLQIVGVPYAITAGHLRRLLAGHPDEITLPRMAPGPQNRWHQDPLACPTRPVLSAPWSRLPGREEVPDTATVCVGCLDFTALHRPLAQVLLEAGLEADPDQSLLPWQLRRGLAVLAAGTDHDAWPQAAARLELALAGVTDSAAVLDHLAAATCPRRPSLDPPPAAAGHRRLCRACSTDELWQPRLIVAVPELHVDGPAVATFGPYELGRAGSPLTGTVLAAGPPRLADLEGAVVVWDSRRDAPVDRLESVLDTVLCLLGAGETYTDARVAWRAALALVQP